jgi:tetratricopeptide (TPR) repeat protein
MNRSTISDFCCTAAITVLILATSPSALLSAEAEAEVDAPQRTAEISVPDGPPATNNALEMRLSQQAIDELRHEIQQSAARNAEAITSSLSLIEPTLARLHERQMEAVQSSNRTIFVVAGIFAAVGFLGLIFVTLILVRAIGRFSEMAVMAGSRGNLLGGGQPMGTIGAGEIPATRPGAAEQASSRFQGAIEQLQKRILELEHSALAGTVDPVHARSQSTSTPGSSKANVEPLTSALNIQPLLATAHPGAGSTAEPAAPTSRTSLLLGKGQALLNLDAAEPALQCFDEVLAQEPNNAEALVRKGMALEKLQDWEQALEHYDRAIAADGSMTVAHLYRGGVCNRLQRYREALESYEQALRTEKKSRAS